jgi:hypothetical protein
MKEFIFEFLGSLPMDTWGRIGFTAVGLLTIFGLWTIGVFWMTPIYSHKMYKLYYWAYIVIASVASALMLIVCPWMFVVGFIIAMLFVIGVAKGDPPKLIQDQACNAIFFAFAGMIVIVGCLGIFEIVYGFWEIVLPAMFFAFVTIFALKTAKKK